MLVPQENVLEGNYINNVNSSDQDITFQRQWQGDVMNANTFYLSSDSGNKISFPTHYWGSQQIKLKDVFIFNDDRCVGTRTTDSGISLKDISYNYEDNNQSIYEATTTEDIEIVTSNNTGTGYITHENVMCYAVIDNRDLSGTFNYIVPGTYIVNLQIGNKLFSGKPDSYKIDFSIQNTILNYNLNHVQGDQDYTRGARIQIRYTTNSYFSTYQRKDVNTINTTTPNNDFIYVSDISRNRVGYELGTDIYGVDTQLTITNGKFIGGTNQTIYDGYGLWFNQNYQYSITAYNTITGETVTTVKEILTRPAIPISFYTITNDPLFITFQWKNFVATGDSNVITYKIQRCRYEESDIILYSKTKTNITDVSCTYNDEYLLYGKEFNFKLTASNQTGNLGYIDTCLLYTSPSPRD